MHKPHAQALIHIRTHTQLWAYVAPGRNATKGTTHSYNNKYNKLVIFCQPQRRLLYFSTNCACSKYMCACVCVCYFVFFVTVPCLISAAVWSVYCLFALNFKVFAIFLAKLSCGYGQTNNTYVYAYIHTLISINMNFLFFSKTLSKLCLLRAFIQFSFTLTYFCFYF